MNRPGVIKSASDRLLCSELAVDALTAAFLAAGTAGGLFRLVDLDASLSAVLAAAAVLTALLLLAARFWPYALALSAAGCAVAVIALWQADELEAVARLWQSFTRWSWTWLQTGLPEAESSLWLDLLRLLILLPLTAIWLTTVRKSGNVLLHASLLALSFTPMLLADPGGLPALLTALAGLVLLLPRRFLRRAHHEAQLTVPLKRAPLQWLALPVAIISLLLSQVAIPENTRSWRWPALANQITDLGDLFQDKLAHGRQWQPFSIGTYGFGGSSGQFGGPARLNTNLVLRVQADQPCLLRGTSLGVYTGSNWERLPSRQYRFASGLWRQLRRQVFSQDLPAGTDGRSFRRQFSRTVRLVIEPLTSGQSTLFFAGRPIRVSTGDELDKAAYFTAQGDLFVFSSLSYRQAYTIDTDLLDRSLPGFDDAMLAIEQDILPASDIGWDLVRATCLQLPDNLPESVRQAAQAAADSSETPYSAALKLEEYFQKDFRYTLNPAEPVSENDFVAGFLTTREGYCVHFASAMVIMARCLGIPARYVEGFALRAAEERQSSDSWVAAGNTAHAWAELYFEGIGWLTFDPTPADPAENPVGPTPAVTPVPSGLPSVSPAPPSPSPGAGQSGSDSRAGRWLVGLIAAALLLAVWPLMSFLLLRRHQARLDPVWARRKYPGTTSRLEFYYHDLLNQLACLDIRPETGETITDFAGRADHRLGFDGIDLVKVLQPVIRWRYGSLAPSEDEVAGLAGLRLRVEARLADSLGKTAYLFRRVLAYLRIGSRNTLFLS